MICEDLGVLLVDKAMDGVVAQMGNSVLSRLPLQVPR